MKRKVLLATILSLFITVPAFAGAIVYKLYPTVYPVLVDGSQISNSLPVMTYKANGGDNTYVPLKAVLNLMGAKTTWDGKKVDIQTGPDPAKVANSVVEIYVSKNGVDVEQGSGVLIDYDEILTCAHVTDKGDKYRIIYNDGITTTATLEKSNTAQDVAILEPDRKDVKPVKIGDSEEVEAGDKVYVIGSPMQKRNVISKGDVVRIKGYVYTSAKSDYGGSGGGLFNGRGELIGTMRSIDKTTHEATAIPLNRIRKTLVY